jgi:ABC-type antimicrobial peptide transport system permease subunit
MHGWLADFAYSISIGASVFLWAALLILVIATLSIIYQASRVAVINPVDTLKWE